MELDVAFSSEEEDAQQQRQQYQERKRDQHSLTTPSAAPAAADRATIDTRPHRHKHKRRSTSHDHATSEDEPSSDSSHSASSSSATSASPPSPHATYTSPPTPQQRPHQLGKTSVQANAQLMEAFASMAARYEAQHPFLSLSSFAECLARWESVCGLYIAAVCIVGYGYLRVAHMLVEGLILIVFTAAALALSMWQSYLEHTELVRLLRARMELVLRLPTLAQQDTSDHPPSSTFVRTHRDGRWRLLPANLLVEGDLIEVDEGDPLPGKCRRVEGVAEAVAVAEGRERQEMRVVEVQQVAAVGGSKRKGEGKDKERNAVATHSHHIMHPSLSASPFHSFSHNPAHHLHPFHPHLSHTHSNPSISHVHDSHAYPRSYPRVLSPGQTSHSSIVNPPPHPPSPPQPPAPPPPLAVGRLPSSFSESALSTLSTGETKAEEAEPPVRPIGPSHGFSSMSSLSSYSPAPPSPAPAAYTLSSLPALAASSSHFYIVIDSPLQQQLSFLLRPPDESRSDRPPQPLTAARVQLIQRRVRWFAVCCFAVYCIVTVIRLSVRHGWPPNGSGIEGKQWYEALFYHSALLLLPLSFLSSAFYMFLLDAVGNAHLLVLQEAVQKRTEQGYGPSSVLGPEGDARERERQEREKRKGGTRRRSDSISSVSTASSDSTDDSDDVAGGEDNDIDHDTFTFIDSLTLSPTSLFHHTVDILTGRELYITRTVNPLLTLGNITTFCCLDAEGILSENEPSPDHLLLYSGGKATVIDIFNDPASANGIMMEGDWQRHMGVLKPVGLNCALNHTCNMRDSQLCEFVVAGGGGGEEREVSGCLCPLAREIGFDVRWIRQQYYISKVLYNVTLMQQSTHGTVKQRRKGRASAKLANKPHNLPSTAAASSYSSLFDAKVRTMTSIAVQDRLLPDSFHLLTNGDPLLTFRHCSAYWDGDEIKAVDDGVASSFQSILQQWWHQDLHCIAFAYTPIPSLYYALLMDEASREREYIIDTWQEAPNWERKPTSGRAADTDGSSDGDGRGGGGGEEEGKDGRRYGASDMATMREDAREEDETALYGGVHSAVAGEYDAKAAQELVDDNEVLLDEATDIVEEENRGARRVRWDSQDVSSAEERDDSIHDAELSFTSVNSNSALPGPPPHSSSSAVTLSISPNHQTASGVLTSVKPVRILRIPALHRTSFSSSQSGPLANPRTPTSASSSIRAGLPTVQSRMSDTPPPSEHDAVTAPAAHIDILDPPPAPGQPDAPAPPAAGSGLNGAVDEVRIRVPSSPTMGDTNDSQLNAPLLASDVPTLRKLQLHPSSSSSSTTLGGMQAGNVPRSSTPSNLSTYLLSSPYNAAARTSSTSIVSPPRPVSTPALLHPDTVPTPSSSFPSKQLQPLLVTASSQPIVAAPSIQPASARPGGSQRRPRASSLTHSHSQQQLATPSLPLPAPSPASFLPSLHHNDSPILPFTMSSPPASSTPSSDTPPPSSRAHNTPTVQPTLTTAPASSSSSFSSPATIPPPLSPTSASGVYKQLQHDQLFLGMVAMRDQPKTEVRSLVEHLMAAGIRFVLFSPENERKTQAFGGKIGLFTDFNVFISLADPEGADDKVERRQGKSQLPRGVSAIRAHLERVDNVPLLVSLFTDCRSADVKEMIRIYQENGESVMCMGSSLKVDNAECFMQADIAASLDPIPSRECQYKTYPSNEERERQQHGGSAGGGGGGSGGGDGMDRESLLGDDYSDSREFAVSSAITSMPCALPLSLTTDLMQFIALICEGRRLSTNFSQVLSFAVQAYLALFILLLTTYIIDTPPLFTGYQLLWHIFLIIPALSFALFFSPRSSDVMTRLADKNVDISSDSSRHMAYFAVRWLPSVLIYALFFLVFLHASFDSALLFRTYYWQSAYSGASLDAVGSYDSVLVEVQAYSQVVYVLALVAHSACMVHRYDSMRRVRPWVNWLWGVVAAACVAAQVVFAAVTWAAAGRVGVSVSWVWYVWLVVWPVWLVTVDELVKAHDRRRKEFYHNRARSHFDTVLGMWSPR